jgi:uncharacterized protein
MAVLLVLVFAGVGLEVSKSSSPTTTATTTTAPTTATAPTTTTAPGGTTTTTTLPATSPQSPVADPLSLNEQARGCGFAMTPASPTTTTTTSPSNTVSPGAIGHCTVLEVGDSLGNDLGWGLAREVSVHSGLELVQRDKSASGLVASWFYNWPLHLKTLLAQYHPDLVIVCVGGDDQQGLVVNGRAYDFDTPQWLARYRVLVGEIDTMITDAGSYVLWVGLPVMQPNIYNRGTAELNAVYRSVAVTVPGVTYLPSWYEFANAEGQYESSALVNGTPAALREADGIHFSYVGENVLATFVTNEIASLYGVRLAPLQPAIVTP